MRAGCSGGRGVATWHSPRGIAFGLSLTGASGRSPSISDGYDIGALRRLPALAVLFKRPINEVLAAAFARLATP